jgi:hypothetical protein
MNRRPHANSLWAEGAALNLCLIVAALQSPAGASAQPAVLNTLDAQAATLAQSIDWATMPYTIKSGDLRVLLAPSLEMDWNDNIAISKTNVLQDYILKPLLQIKVDYPLTQVNLLRLDVGVGYDEYLEHRDYSNLRVDSASQVSFDTYIKDVLINLHDRVSFAQDAGAQSVDAGVGNYGSGKNVVGLTTTWKPNNLNIILGYDHQTALSTGTEIQSQNGSSELVDGRVGWMFGPTTTAGVELTYSSTAYDEALLNNNTSYTIGAYALWHPGSYFNVTSRAGYAIFQFQQTSESSELIDLTPTGNPIVMLTGQPIATSDFNTWYADVTLTHDITQAINYSLSAGHKIQGGIQSDEVSETYLRLSSSWKVIKDLDLQGSFSYVHGQQGVGNLSGNLTETYDWYTGSLEISRQLSTRLRAGLHSRITFRSSSTEYLGYTQALVGLKMTYAFQ